MAADILLYAAHRVPVGGDQDQHVELAPDLAIRFNRTYGQTFVVPELHRGPATGRVRDLLTPTAKMSESDPDEAGGVLRMLDSPEVLRRRVLRVVTDCDGEVRRDEAAKPGVTNLLEILGVCSGTDPADAAARYTSYGDLKTNTADAVVTLLEPAQRRYAELAANPGGVDTLAALTPSSSAIVRVLQCVAATGLLWVVNSTKRATSTVTSGAPRGKSRSMPANRYRP